jgi:hypothetical protein
MFWGFVPTAAVAQPAGTQNAESSEFKIEDYCTRVREAGASAAATLLGPRVGLQAIKFPAEGDLVLGQTLASETQFRSFAQYSLSDAYHGVLTLGLGDAECRRERLAEPLKDAIRLATDQGRRDALAAKVKFLHEQDASVESIERDAEARRRAEVGTLADFMEILSLVSSFHEQESSSEDDLGRLSAAALREPTAELSRQVAAYERAVMDLEELGSGIRRVQPWGVAVSGGVAVTPSVAPDWFLTAEVSYNLGGIAQASAERRMLEARQRELDSSNDEIPVAARAVDAALRASVERLERQIADAEKDVQRLQSEESSLAQSDASGSRMLAASIRVRRLLAQANLVYLQTLAEKRRPWAAR